MCVYIYIYIYVYIYICIYICVYIYIYRLMPSFDIVGGKGKTTVHSEEAIGIECLYVTVHSVQITSTIASVHLGRGILLCCSPEGFFPFLPVKGFILFLGNFSDVRSWDRDVVCVQIVKASEANS